MNEVKKDRRGFMKLAAKGAIVSAGGPAFFSGLLSSCHMGKALVSAEGDDLKRLQELIGNKTRPLKWVFAGDSITQGAKHTLGYRSYPEIFSERIRFEMSRYRDMVINAAVSGNTTKEIVSDFDWRVAQFKPDVVFLMIGTNDAAKVRKMTVEEFGNNLKVLIQKIRALHAIPVLQTPNIINMGANAANNERASLPDFVSEMRKQATTAHTILVDHWKYWEDRTQTVYDEHWLNDPLHPNGKGHLQMARLLFNTLQICDAQSFTCAGEVHF